MFPTIATTRAVTRDHVAGRQQQRHTGKVMSDCFNIFLKFRMIFSSSTKLRDGSEVSLSAGEMKNKQRKGY
jgi:hypothetical protein